MAYVVLRCPDCRSALVADDTNETATCGRCDNRVTIDDMRAFHRSEDHEAAVHAAGAVNADRDGDAGAYWEEIDDGDEPRADALDAAVRRGRQAGADGSDAVLALAEREDLTVDRVAELLARLDDDPDRARKLLDRLADRGDLYRPSPGVWRSAPSG